MSETLEQVVERVVRNAAQKAVDDVTIGRPLDQAYVGITESVIAQFLPMMLKLAGRVAEWRSEAQGFRAYSDDEGEPLESQDCDKRADELETTLREMIKIPKDNI